MRRKSHVTEIPYYWDTLSQLDAVKLAYRAIELQQANPNRTYRSIAEEFQFPYQKLRALVHSIMMQNKTYTPHETKNPCRNFSISLTTQTIKLITYMLAKKQRTNRSQFLSEIVTQFIDQFPPTLNDFLQGDAV